MKTNTDTRQRKATLETMLRIATTEATITKSAARKADAEATIARIQTELAR